MYVLRAALLCKQQEREMKEKTNCSILFHVIKTTTHRQSLCEPLYNYNTIHKKKEKTNCSILFHVIKKQRIGSHCVSHCILITLYIWIYLFCSSVVRVAQFTGKTQPALSELQVYTYLT